MPVNKSEGSKTPEQGGSTDVIKSCRLGAQELICRKNMPPDTEMTRRIWAFRLGFVLPNRTYNCVYCNLCGMLYKI